MEYNIGQIVYSKDGHDKGDAMVVLAVEGKFLYLVDGKRRTLQKPKKKSKIHVQPTHFVDVLVAKKISDQAYLLDADIRKAIRSYIEKDC